MKLISCFIVCFLQMIISEKLKASNYKVLILTSPFGTRAHSIYFHAIAKHLASNGNQVTHHSIDHMEASEGVRNQMKTYHFKQIYFRLCFQTNSVGQAFEAFSDNYPSLIHDIVNKTYTDPLIMDLVGQPMDTISNTSKYDIVLIDAVYSEIYLPLVHHLGVPSILVTPTMLVAPYAWIMDAPYHYFINGLGFPDTLSLSTRVYSFLFHSVLNLINYSLLWETEKAIGTYLPNSPPLEELKRNISFLMTATTHSIYDSMPSTPRVIHVGCAHCRPANQLPNQLEEVMQSSDEHGVIYFSLGSYITHNPVLNEFKKKVMNVLKRFNQTILWKGGINETKLKNFYVSDWFPQQDILGHPKLRLVISHGGLTTGQEVSYHGCPVLGFPLGHDHHYSMYSAKVNGYGELLDWRTFSEDDLHQTITRMLTNKTYKEAALRASIRMRDVLDDPTEQVAYWIDYTLRHKGASSFLNTHEHSLYWYQYFLIDVIALILTVSCTIIIVIYWLLKLFIRKILFRPLNSSRQ